MKREVKDVGFIDGFWMDHKNLDVWKSGIDLVVIVYEIIKIFPKEEMYGLTSQLRRAAVSIPSNIAEAAARSSDKEFIQVLYYALASLAEENEMKVLMQIKRWTKSHVIGRHKV